MQSIFSPGPELETFSTPPSSPTVLDRNVLDRPSLSRRGSRPSSLRIQQNANEWKSDVVLDHQVSPPVTMSANATTPQTAVPNVNGRPKGFPPNGHLSPTNIADPAPGSSIAQNLASAMGSRPAHLQSKRQPSPMRSPCFVHSHLQGPSFSDWLHAKQQKSVQEVRTGDARGGGSLPHPLGLSYPDGTVSDVPEEGYHDLSDEEETAGSLTKQLAETAVGVREMSKQLGTHSLPSSLAPDPVSLTGMVCRSHKSALQYSINSDRYESPR